MEINKLMTISSEDLTEGIRFHGETRADDKACEKIQQLDNLINDVLWHLIRTQEQAECNPKNASSQEIREELDKVFKTVDALSNIYNDREELL